MRNLQEEKRLIIADLSQTYSNALSQVALITQSCTHLVYGIFMKKQGQEEGERSTLHWLDPGVPSTRRSRLSTLRLISDWGLRLRYRRRTGRLKRRSAMHAIAERSRQGKKARRRLKKDKTSLNSCTNAIYHWGERATGHARPSRAMRRKDRRLSGYWQGGKRKESRWQAGGCVTLRGRQSGLK